jgi:hypothetical protein
VRVHLAPEHALELEVAHVGLKALRVALDVARRSLIILRLGELQQLGGVADALGGAIDLPDITAQACALASEFLRAGRIGPYEGVLQLARYFLEALLLEIVLKETPVARRCAPRDL